MPLKASHDDLADLADGHPEIVDEMLGEATGIRLLKKLGIGGMASVFLAERLGGAPLRMLSPLTPERLAVKVMQVSTARELQKLGADPLKSFSRESVALARLSDRRPPTPNVVGFYGSGLVDVETRGGVRRLPWLALEHVDGGASGTTLSERIDHARDGIDPHRALRLVRGIVHGLLAIHEEKMIHRDLKPDNVLVAGPIDDETPKLTDYGIARVEGLETGIAGATLAYAGFEQLIPSGGARNPLIGPWSDVHALACVVWFIVAGEQWYVDASWFSGARRSIRTAARLHPGFVHDVQGLDALDAVLAKGASPKLPREALAADSAQIFETVVSSRYPAMREGVERYADVNAFTRALMPVLESIAGKWAERATRENIPVTAYRATITVREDERERPCHFEALEIKPIHPPMEPPNLHALGPMSVAFQPDGKLLARDGDRLIFVVDRQPYSVVPPKIDGELVSLDESWRVIHAGELGFALVSPKRVMFVRGGRWSVMPTPFDPSGREVGEICAAASTRGQLVVVTEETDDSEGGPELWRTSDGERWSTPVAIPIGGAVRAVSEGPFGTLLVGDKNGKRGRAAFVAPDGTTTVFAAGIASGPPLHLALCSYERESWGATATSIVRFDRGAAESELDALEARPTALALDLVGVPWMLTENAVHRRDGASTAHRWRVVLERPRDLAPLAAIGFTPEGARVIDRDGNGVRIVPGDVDRWRRETM